jgi:serine protease Do
MLRMGSLQSSRLDALSSTVQDGRPAEAWRLTGTAGQRVSIVMTSEDFDTYLYLTGPGLDQVLTDDDGAGDLDSKIDVTLPTSGPFTVVAAALSSGSSGSYTIRVETPFDMNTLATDGRVIDLGQSVAGQLSSRDPIVDDGRRGQAWAFDGISGQRVVIDLWADDFDAYLYLVGPGLPEPLEDDDGGDSLNSRIETVLPGTGTYRVIASSLSDGAGSYTLRVTRR